MTSIEFVALLALFFTYAGDLPPAVNEAHYLVKAKNFWDPAFASTDLFAASGKAHTTFYLTFGWLTQFLSLEASAWVGRVIGWSLVALGLLRCCRQLSLPTFSCVAVAILWLIGISHGNLAGEWVVGGIEGKVPAYGCGLIGISFAMQRRWSVAWVWYGIASAFHVLTGGWLVIATMIAFAATEFRSPRNDRAAFWTLGLWIGGAIALAGLVPALRLTMEATAEQRNLAARIYSYVRIRHHLLPSDFPPHWFIRHGVLIATMLGLFLLTPATAIRKRLVWIGIGATCITVIGLLVGFLPTVAPDLAAKLLRYYWFRLGDAIVPLVIALSLAELLFAKDRETPQAVSASRLRSYVRGMAASLLVIGAMLFAAACVERIRIGVPPSASHRLLGFDPDASPQQQQQVFRDWVAVCDWARSSTPVSEVFLTPRHQQTFKWYAGRGEVVNWKDVPQDATSLIEWLERFEDVFPKHVGAVSLGSMRVPINYAKLRRYRERYGVRLMIVDNRIASSIPLAKIYPVGNQQNQTYSVYELPN
ncbi:DUF6798 domain-containing protein [Roseiconus lacunae]|uniref:DUF6798 domain-containing protein n=1 Tax=Roseiconus lacunae TaxID=2605694 RepID=UPI001E40C00D|nr:DUF6798 domain-containing protein [Roseiconus lacunae]MCD0461919.1 hypothetical protein [Roseiconus lacunae]